MTDVPDAVVLRFFQRAAETLDGLDCAAECEHRLTVDQCRRLLLERQLSLLDQVVGQYNENEAVQVQTSTVQERLSMLRHDKSTPDVVLAAMIGMEEAARRALVRLVLYSESKEETDAASDRKLQDDGTFGRDRLVEFIALNQAACKLPAMAEYLQSGAWIFEDVPLDEPESAMKFPQKRLERVQCMIARAIGMEPSFVTSELKRLFFDVSTANDNEYSDDTELRLMFEQLLSQISVIVSAASLRTTDGRLSDVSDGGVTRVVSVNFTDVGGDASDEPARVGQGVAPTTARMDESAEREAGRIGDEDNSDDVAKKRQIRLANEAAAMHKAIVEELLSMPEKERERKLEEARQASAQFLDKAMKLHPGAERVALLRRVDPQTQKLLAMQKIWAQHLEANSGAR